MRCMECGQELSVQDRMRNGAYRCPNCGKIYQTASSSRVSPSPWRPKHRPSLARRRGRPPLWAWLSILLLVIAIAIILPLALRHSKGAPASNNMDAVVDEPRFEEVPAESISAENVIDSPETAASATDDAALEKFFGDLATDAVPLGNTHVTSDEFVSHFNSTITQLGQSAALTYLNSEVGVNGENVQSYSYEDWLDLTLTLDVETSTIQEVVAAASAESAAAEDTRLLAAFVAVLYSLDSSMDTSAGLEQLSAMLSDNSLTYQGSNCTASISNSEFSGYMLEVRGTL